MKRLTDSDVMAMTDADVLAHDIFDVAYQNICEERGRGPVSTHENTEFDTAAIKQARGLIDAGECICCERVI